MSNSLPPVRDVAVLGLGLMGRASAVRLQQAGFNVVAWNRTRRDDLPCEVSLAPDLERACGAPIIILLLSDSTAVDEILSNIEPFLRHGQIVVDMGSSEPWRSERHAARLAARGIGWVDAPVSGGPEGAGQGELAIMVGGDATHVTRVKPILDALGSNVTHVGGPGAGHTTKVVNQTMVGVLIEAVAEGLALAERAGLDPILVGEAVRGGSADTRPLRAQGPRMIARDYAPRAHVTTMLKDLRMAAELGDRLGVELPCVERVIELAELLVQQGHGELDISALHRLRTD
jgi:2-hydroxy-3-oxopropionate reductase